MGFRVSTCLVAGQCPTEDMLASEKETNWGRGAQVAKLVSLSRISTISTLIGKEFAAEVLPKNLKPI